MKSVGEVAATLAQSPQQLTATLNASSAKLAEMAKYAKLLLGCYRTGDANDPEVYTASVIAVLSDYPIEVVQKVVDPRGGIPSRIQWLPTPAEIRKACDEAYWPIKYWREYDERSRAQLAERARLEALPPPKQTYEEFKAEVAARGMPIDRQQAQREDVAKFLEKHGVTHEQWAALPDLPQKVADRNPERYDAP